MPTHCKGYWNNSLIKIICLPISRKKQGCSLSVAEQGSDSPARIAPLEHCHSQGCAHSTALPRPGMRWGLAEPPQHPALPLAAGVWPAVTKTGPTVSWKSSLWHAVPGGHGGCGDRGAGDSPSSSLLSASDRRAWHTPETPQTEPALQQWWDTDYNRLMAIVYLLSFQQNYTPNFSPRKSIIISNSTSELITNEVTCLIQRGFQFCFVFLNVTQKLRN